MKFSIYCRHDEYSRGLREELITILETDPDWIFDEANPDLVICIGGDGTLLRAIHHYEDQLSTLLFTAIHTGTLGFFTDYTHEEIAQFLEDLKHKTPKIESYPLIEARLDTGQSYYALNEIRIGSFAYTIRFDVYIDEEFFEHVSSCGICVSTQAGSTGANRALEGAVVENGLEVLELTQIMPVSHINHHSLVSPYIMNRNRIIDLKGESLAEAVLCYDHLETGKLDGVSHVSIRLSDRQVHFARFRPYSYLKRLRNLF